MILCVQCGNEFEPNHHRRKLCSPECAAACNRAKIKAWQAANREHISARRKARRRAIVDADAGNQLLLTMTGIPLWAFETAAGLRSDGPYDSPKQRNLVIGARKWLFAAL